MNGFYRLTRFLFLMLCIYLDAADGATWIENFNNASLDSWAKHDPENKSTWQPEDGYLDVWVQPPPPPGGYDEYVLQFIGFEFDVDELNVQLKVLEERNASVGILIGQYDSSGDIFDRTISILHASFFGKIVIVPEKFDLLERDREVFQAPAQPNALEISFHRGDFEVLIDKKYFAKYHVRQLKTINCIGITSVVGLGRGVIANLVLDDFIVSGPDVPENGILNVHPKGKAAVRWGELKQR